MTERTYHIATNLAVLRIAKNTMREVFLCDDLLPVSAEIREKWRQAFVAIDELTDIYYKASRR